MSVTLSLTELGGVVAFAVALATTDAARISRIFIAYMARKLGVSASEIEKMDEATDS